MLGLTTNRDPGTTGMKEIANAMGGGIRDNSLVIIEGEAKTGKSVLCQHVAYGVLHNRGSDVTYYSSEYNAETLVMQLHSMDMDVRHELMTDRFRIFKFAKAEILTDGGVYLEKVWKHIKSQPPRFKLIIIDSLSPIMLSLEPVVKMDFLEVCKEMCRDGRSIILTLDTHVLEHNVRQRTYDMSDYYLRLTSPNVMLGKGQMEIRVIKQLEVTKLAGAERRGQEPLKFEIKPRVGIQLLPFLQVKV
jgi:archaellum biogenesis ATPase FlaH